MLLSLTEKSEALDLLERVERLGPEARWTSTPRKVSTWCYTWLKTATGVICRSLKTNWPKLSNGCKALLLKCPFHKIGEKDGGMRVPDLFAVPCAGVDAVFVCFVLETIRTGAMRVIHIPVKTEETQRLRIKFVLYCPICALNLKIKRANFCRK